MPKFRKSSPDIEARFEAALPADPAIQPRKMFGYKAAFVKGNFFAGLFEESVVLRLPDELHRALPDMAAAEGFNPMGKGKGMAGWFVVPEPVSADPDRLQRLLAAALTLVSELPAKPSKPARSRAGSVSAKGAPPSRPAPPPRRPRGGKV
jgi:TfoX/Sxy family transcriptional regulator of competence genes